MEHTNRRDKDQLAQLIRREAHFIDLATKCDDKNYKSKSYAILKELLTDRHERKYDKGPDIIWAEKMLTYYESWSINAKKVIISSAHKHDEDAESKLFSVIKERRSIRFWKKKPVPRSCLTKIIEAATYAPTAFNKMPWKFFVFENDPESMVEGSVTNGSMFEKAPVCIYVGIDERLYDEKFAPALDAGLAVQNMILEAHALGLGSCIIYQSEIIDQDALKNSFRIPEYYYVYCAVVLGYPNDAPKIPGRPNATDVTVFINKTKTSSI